jgi:hypothetical protein
MMMMMNSRLNKTKNRGQKLLCHLERKPEKLILELLYGCKLEIRRCQGCLGGEEEEEEEEEETVLILVHNWKRSRA